MLKYKEYYDRDLKWYESLQISDNAAPKDG